MLLNGFAQFEGLEGKSSDAAFKDETPKPVEIFSFHHQLSRSGWDKQTSGDEDYLPKQTTHGQLTIIKPVDALSVKIAEAICSATRFSKVDLVCRGPILDSDKMVEKDLLRITIHQVLISRYHYVGDPRLHVFGRGGAGERQQPILSGPILEMGPLEEVELLYFGKIAWLHAKENAAKEATPPVGKGD